MLDEMPVAELTDLCRKWKVAELALFGSALRADFRPDSDIDLLVTYAPDARWGLFAESRMAEEFRALLKRPVDLVDRRAVERSRNWIRKEEILSTAKRVYPRLEAASGS